jgi:hypothetical protein
MTSPPGATMFAGHGPGAASATPYLDRDGSIPQRALAGCHSVGKRRPSAASLGTSQLASFHIKTRFRFVELIASKSPHYAVRPATRRHKYVD